MRFAAVFQSLALAPDTQAHGLSDGRFACAYAQLPQLLAEVQHWLQAQGVEAGDCLALECLNAVPAALGLLALLQRGQSFALLPPSEGDAKAEALKPMPRFCRYRLRVRRAADKDGVALAGFAQRFFSLAANPDYAPGPAIAPGKLYARTSGSMGAAKLAVHDQARLFGNAQNCMEQYGFASSDRLALPIPIFHLYGAAAAFLPAVLAGACVDLQERANVLRYLERERQFQPNAVYLTPVLCEMLLKGLRSPRQYRWAVTSGQRIGADLFRAFDACIGGRLVNQYGSTEMGATAACAPGAPLQERMAYIGPPMPGVQLEVRPDGLLWCQHPFGYEGYVDESGAWLRQMAADEWHCTGDLAEQAATGHIRVLGRAGDSVNRRGYLVLLADIEARLEKLEGVGQAAVIACGAEGERLAAFCVAKPGAVLEAGQIRAACFELLPAYAIPDRVEIAAALPLLPSGKIDRQALAGRLG
jgi:acyl-coenzyme A synthetase/AMP-(fatty) acid ligase